MSNEFNDILNYDPLHEAEQATGLSYKEDPGTSALGMLLMQENEQRKKDELSVRGDLYRSMKFHEAVDVVLGAGFEPVYAQVMRDTAKYGNGNQVHFYVYWRKGVLLTLESFNWSKTDDEREMTVNKAYINFNWRSKTGETALPKVPFSGGWQHRSKGFDDVEGDPWTLVAGIQVTEGLLHYLDILESEGEFLETWYITDGLYDIISYPEERDSGDFSKEGLKRDKALRLERINAFGEPAKSAILAGIGEGWDY